MIAASPSPVRRGWYRRHNHYSNKHSHWYDAEGATCIQARGARKSDFVPVPASDLTPSGQPFGLVCSTCAERARR